MKQLFQRLYLRLEESVLTARQWARQAASLLGFDTQNQVRIATTASEVARDGFAHGPEGYLEFFLLNEPVPLLRIVMELPGTR